MLPVLLGDNLGAFWHDTIVYQADRTSPFSIWGLWGGLSFEQHLVQGATVALAIVVAFVPRRRGVVEVAALAAAVLIALQLSASYWLYSYIVWFFPLVAIALFGSFPSREPRDAQRVCWCRLQHLLDRRRPHSLRGGDQHPVQPRVLGRGLELDRHPRDHRLERLLALDADDAAARPGHADVGDVGGPAGQHARVGGRDVGVGADDGGHRPSRCQPIPTFSLVASACMSTSMWSTPSFSARAGRRRPPGTPAARRS